jgi:hypothetical protein
MERPYSDPTRHVMRRDDKRGDDIHAGCGAAPEPNNMLKN